MNLWWWFTCGVLNFKHNSPITFLTIQTFPMNLVIQFLVFMLHLGSSIGWLVGLSVFPCNKFFTTSMVPRKLIFGMHLFLLQEILRKKLEIFWGLLTKLNFKVFFKDISIIKQARRGNWIKEKNSAEINKRETKMN